MTKHKIAMYRDTSVIERYFIKYWNAPDPERMDTVNEAYVELMEMKPFVRKASGYVGNVTDAFRSGLASFQTMRDHFSKEGTRFIKEFDSQLIGDHFERIESTTKDLERAKQRFDDVR